MRATLVAKEDKASKQIDEIEEYLGLLRSQKAVIQIRVSEADEQLCMVKEALDNVRIAEVSQSDDEDSSRSSPPQLSDYACINTDSDYELDNQSVSTSDTSIEQGKPSTPLITSSNIHCGTRSD